jgi:hypothetical protein
MYIYNYYYSYIVTSITNSNVCWQMMIIIVYDIWYTITGIYNYVDI